MNYVSLRDQCSTFAAITEIISSASSVCCLSFSFFPRKSPICNWEMSA